MFGHTFIPFRRFPQVFPIVTSILIVQTVVFVMLILKGQAFEPQSWIRYGAYEGWRIEEGEYWRFLFSLFLNVNFFQFIFSSLLIYIFGPQLEWFFGKVKFSLLFLITGIMGNVGVYFSNLQGVYTGNDFSIYGFLGVYLYLYAMKSIDPHLGKGLFILTLINLFFHFELLYAHIISLISGFLLTFLFTHLKTNNKF